MEIRRIAIHVLTHLTLYVKSTRMNVPADPRLEKVRLQLLTNSYKIYHGCAQTTGLGVAKAK